MSNFLSSSSYPGPFNLSSSSGGAGEDPASLDSTEYPTVFLLAIFVPAVVVGALFVYFHYAMRHWGELRWPWNAPGGSKRRRIAVTQPAGGGVNLVAELRSELGGVSGSGGPNDSFYGSSDTVVGRERPGSHPMHAPLLADNIF